MDKRRSNQKKADIQMQVHFLNCSRTFFSGVTKLAQLIILRRQVLLHAKSGVGKTSHLMAGFLLKLKNKYLELNYKPCNKRLSQREDADKLQIKKIIDDNLWLTVQQINA